MNLPKISKKAKAYATLIIFLIVLGVFAIGVFKFTKWTNEHTVTYRTPIQKPWVVTKKGAEQSQEQELAQQIVEAKQQLEKLQLWASSVDRELPDDLKVSPQGK